MVSMGADLREFLKFILFEESVGVGVVGGESRRTKEEVPTRANLRARPIDLGGNGV